jgi:dipeptidyl aminopeptidase/acylaminoacyl peptidase
VSIVDSSADEGKLLVFAGTDPQPGNFYVFDKSTSQLALLVPARPELEGMQFGHMRPIAYPAADGTMIPAYLTLPPGSDGKNLPAIVMPHGGPDARDEWGFDWLVQYFAVRGFAVLQPEYRGSAGYGNDWFKGNAFHSWKTLVHGDTDTNVGVSESRLMNDRLKAAGKQVEYTEFKGLTHQLDDAGARARMLVAAEKTIRQGMGLK